MEFHSMEDFLLEKIKELIEEKEKSGREIGQEKIEKMVEKMYSPEMIDKFSNTMYESLINQASIMYEEHRLEQQEFEARLQMRWLDAFYGLKSVITISEEIGMGVINEFLEKSKDDDGVSTIPLEYDIAFKLHGKSVVVSKEILTLLQSGYSDAAISRWRTLHEISVILNLITDTLQNNTNLAKELAIRFYKRSIVEEFKIEKIDSKRSLEEFIGLKAQVDEIKKSYGEKFIYEEYEWARPVLPKIKGRIYFSNLEKKTRSTKLTSYYKMANNQIHSTSFGLYKSFGDMYDSGTGVIFGPSNYGLSIPGQLTIISIIRSTSSLLAVDLNLDKIMMISILQKFFERYSSVFDDIQTNIEKEEEIMEKEK